MKQDIEFRLGQLVSAGQQRLLAGGLKGLEKESLRVTGDARIAATPHPSSLGSALTHPHITTDYSEALIELITPPSADAEATLEYLADLHRFVCQHVGDELLWPVSMPCEIAGDESIPIARYGSSNIGRMKHVYRVGLAWRYGRAMQAIAGVHFNYSLNEDLWPVWHELQGRRGGLMQFRSEEYLGLIRNVKRYGWIVLYLFGASPALAKSFFSGKQELGKRFPVFDTATLYRPHATSLRMSDIGYRNDSQSDLDISCNSLEQYVRCLAEAVNTHYPPYDKIGVKVNGEYRQLSANILQISNEYYSAIRPKQITESGERPVAALRRRGVHYVELRSVDLCGNYPVGVSLEQLRFLELFLLYCFLRESPPVEGQEKADIAANSFGVACCGRTPGFSLKRAGSEVSLRDWAGEILNDIAVIADILDESRPGRPYRSSVDGLLPAVADPEATPSARVLREMSERKESFIDYGLRLARSHGQQFRAEPLAPERLAEFQNQAAASLERQRQIEASDRVGFDEYLRQYFAKSLLEDPPQMQRRAGNA